MNHRFSAPIFAPLTQKIDPYKTLTRNHQREGAGAYFRRSGCSNRSIKGTAGDGNQASFHWVRSAAVAGNAMSILTIKPSLDIGAKLRLGKRTRYCGVWGFVTRPAAERGPRAYAARLGMAFDIPYQGLLPGVAEHFPDHARQPHPPWRGMDSENPLDLPAIENRVHRTLCRRRVLVGSDRLNLRTGR